MLVIGNEKLGCYDNPRPTIACVHVLLCSDFKYVIVEEIPHLDQAVGLEGSKAMGIGAMMTFMNNVDTWISCGVHNDVAAFKASAICEAFVRITCIIWIQRDIN